MADKYESWRRERQAELESPDSWLGLIGLHWLVQGENRIGSSVDCAVRLPAGPACLGRLHWIGDKLLWQPVDGDERHLSSDRDGQPTVVEFENWAFFPVDREGRIAIRVRDRAWALKKPFAGISCYAYDPAWSIEADWQVLSQPQTITVPNITGDLKDVEVTHRAAFKLGDVAIDLLPMSVGEREVFFIFRDRTSGKETYGAGRFLKVKPAVDGRIRLDFNFAYNPPCAFTPFATCPLPPPENWLPFPVTAGEKKYSGEH